MIHSLAPDKAQLHLITQVLTYPNVVNIKYRGNYGIHVPHAATLAFLEIHVSNFLKSLGYAKLAIRVDFPRTTLQRVYSTAT